MAGKIEVVRGTSNTLEIEVTDLYNNPYTLESGDKLLFGVKNEPGDGEYIILKTITSGKEGCYMVELKPNDTSGLAYGRYVFDVGLEHGEDFFSIIEASPFVVLPNVTKWGDGL